MLRLSISEAARRFRVAGHGGLVGMAGPGTGQVPAEVTSPGWHPGTCRALEGTWFQGQLRTFEKKTTPGKEKDLLSIY